MRQRTRRLLQSAGIVWYPRPPEVLDDVWWTGRHAWEETVLRAFGTLVAAPFPLQHRPNCGLQSLTTRDAYILSSAGRVGEVLLLESEKLEWRVPLGAHYMTAGPAIDVLRRSKLRWVRSGLEQLQMSGAMNEKGEWQDDRLYDLKRRLGRPPTEPCRSHDELIW